MVDLFVNLYDRHSLKVILSEFGLPFPPMDSPHSCKLFNNCFMLSVAIRIGVLGLF